MHVSWNLRLDSQRQTLDVNGITGKTFSLIESDYTFFKRGTNYHVDGVTTNRCGRSLRRFSLWVILGIYMDPRT